MLGGPVVGGAATVEDEGAVDGVPLVGATPELDEVSLPLAELLPDEPPAGVTLAGGLTGALVCELRGVEAGTAPELVALADGVGLAALVDAAAEVWAASIDADALVGALSTGLLRPEDDATAAGWPCPAINEGAVVAGEMAHTMTAHSPTPTPAAMASASR